MNSLEQTVLSEIEKKALKALETEETLTTEQIAEKSALNLDSVRRAMSWLNDKKLAIMLEKSTEKILLSDSGKRAIAEGIPEKQLLMLLEQEGGKSDLHNLMQELNLGKEFNYALGILKQKNFVTVVKAEKGLEVSLTGLEEEVKKNGFAEERILQKIFARQTLSSEDMERIPELQKRGLVEKKVIVDRSSKITAEGLKITKTLKSNLEEINALTSTIIKAGSWKGKSFKKYNISDPVSEIFA
ncbi:MAG: hypothetical protein Q7R70_03820 [Candidatus Diapherotrites archaeon]|nr:hypothetical protein [Candidatus Diapherotrites archaeon]